MWVRARHAVAKWLAPEPPPPSPPVVSPETRAQREWAARLARIADERRQAQAAREAAEQAADEVAREQAALRREQILDHVARYGHWFPGDRLMPREPPRGWLGRVWEIFR